MNDDIIVTLEEQNINAQLELEEQNINAQLELVDASFIPRKLSDLEDDETHRTVTDIEKGYWNGKQDKLININRASSGVVNTIY
jgi:hypothetical protein